MKSSDRFARFARSFEARDPGHVVTGADLVGFAEDASLSLAEASVALECLIATGRWERVHVDSTGRALHPEEVVQRLTAFAFGSVDLAVAWRRRRPEAVLAA